MKVICEHKNKCKNSTCMHRAEHEEGGVLSECTSGLCSIVNERVICIPINRDWDE